MPLLPRAVKLRASMRSADRHPSMLAGTRPDRSDGICQFRSDRLAIKTPSRSQNSSAYRNSGHGSKGSPFVMAAQAIRAVLLANATVTTLKGLLRSRSVIRTLSPVRSARAVPQFLRHGPGGPDVAVAPLAGAPNPFFAAGRMLLRHEAEPGREVSARCELLRVAYHRRDRRPT